MSRPYQMQMWLESGNTPISIFPHQGGRGKRGKDGFPPSREQEWVGVKPLGDLLRIIVMDKKEKMDSRFRGRKGVAGGRDKGGGDYGYASPYVGAGFAGE